ncbi:shikimate / quinate 5-dehydrogenase, protein [Paecilomyces variotii No. 5]|uniref:Shikimate / quinate 5-dehydrogenase, protein n=1 Tax=Byssochlamys spectabilis (strain No. 5 / NBRC 109023) TaxID=1356009 RepID=V5FSP0_BYSSN|nr:shikimate / quinate 5-dehydrogenase, protein [Paecilomyces variotii No. 5]
MHAHILPSGITLKHVEARQAKAIAVLGTMFAIFSRLVPSGSALLLIDVPVPFYADLRFAVFPYLVTLFLHHILALYSEIRMGSYAESQDRGILPKQFHIFGNGISFSISPIIHNAGFRHDGLPYTYDIQESRNIDEVAHLISRDEFGGASVTMPHKLQVHKYCDRESETAKSIGAINTLVVGYDGANRTITGENTDWSGLHAIINNYKTRSGKKMDAGLVIGAGGASRAALYAMYRAGIRTIYLVNRTFSRAESVRETFKDLFSVTILQNLRGLPQDIHVIIGTIPAHVTTEEQYHNLFGGCGLCIDMSYKPRQTPLLKAAKRNSEWETITGLQVLLAQAFDQYRLWTGKEPPRKVIVDAIIAHEGGQNIENIEVEGKL